LVTLARVRLWPFVVGLPIAGWAWAHWDRALPLRGAEGIGLVVVAWTLLHAGTLWLNAAVDRDQGEVLFGRSAKVPSIAVPAAALALAATVPVAAMAGVWSAFAAAWCVVLAVSYSHPHAPWKGHPVGGPAVNVLGYGLLSPFAGWAVVGVAADPRTVAVWTLAALGILGTTFAAQAFQGEEDRARGYRTLVATHGARVTLTAARVTIGVAFLGAVTLCGIGWLPRVCLAGALWFVVVDRWLSRWVGQPGGGSERWARGFTWRLGGALVAGILLAFGEYVRESYAGEPVAGLGTASGHPPDRPRLPPAALRRWETTRSPFWYAETPTVAHGDR
jgi:lycopene elongase/hydratase (dihydrobisanhydrobacterioruberin-forming)